MPTYLVTFQDGRIGRTLQHGPVTIRCQDLGDLADAVYDVTRPHLYSAYPEVVIEQQEDDPHPVGLVFAGFHTVARFDVQELRDAVAH